LSASEARILSGKTGALALWFANIRIEVGMGELGADPTEASGDVDVLAWKSNVVCVCECKELLFARNIGEVAAQLTDFRGKPGDDLDKHLRRVKFIQFHTDSVFRITKVENPRIIPLLVTSKIVPMQYVQGLTTEVVSADQLTPTYLGNLVR
jgi:hypothetical protein